MLQKSLHELVAVYADKPISILDYDEIGMGKKLVEIRFEEEAITMTCVFDKSDKCISTYFFADNDDLLKSFIRYLQHTGDLHIANNLLGLDTCCLRVRRSSTHKYQYLIFYI